MRILQVSCSYLPDVLAGTEVYVHTLNQELLSRGHTVFVHYIGNFCEESTQQARTREYHFEGVPVFVIEKNSGRYKTGDIYFDSTEIVYSLFKEYLERIAPDIVHFHHFSPTDVVTEMKIARGMGLPVVLTFHTSSMSCVCGDMRYLAKSLCVGRLDDKKCTECMQIRHRVPRLLARVWSMLPLRLARTVYAAAVRYIASPSRLSTWLQMPYLNKMCIEKLRSGFLMVDYFVAVCQWGFDLLVQNGIPPEKIVMCRHGVTAVPALTRRKKGDTLRVGFLGRLVPVKGLEVLLKAIHMLAESIKIELYVYGKPEQEGLNRAYYDRLVTRYADKRIKWLGKLSGEDKFVALSQLDILVIPSIMIETGPLVLLEAWAAGTPVIGARMGGILELMQEEAGGLLFDPENAEDLARALTRVSQSPALLARLQSTIPALRSVKAVADDMEILYHSLKKQQGGAAFHGAS